MIGLQAKARAELLRRQVLPAQFGAVAVRPSYDGLGLTNVPALALDLLGVEGNAVVPPVNPALLGVPELTTAFEQVLKQGAVNHVVLLLIDALGYDQLLTEFQHNNAPHLQAATENAQNFLMPLTSVYPSTTTTALTSVATAQPPQAHGIMGTVCFFGEIGTTVNLIHYTPAFDWDVKPLAAHTLNYDTLVPVPNMYQMVENAGHQSQIVNYYQFEGSSISRYTSAGSKARYIGYITPAVGFAQLRRLVQSLPSDGSSRSFTYSYVPTVDTTAHKYGPLSEEYHAEIAALDFSLHNEFLKRITNRPDVLFMLVADHGQTVIDPAKTIFLHDYPEFTRYLTTPVTGERRAIYMHIKNGKIAEAKSGFEKHFGEHFVCLTRDKAIGLGLFGDPRQLVLPQAADRMGDLLAFPKGDWQLRHPVNKDDRGYGSIGVHAGLSQTEMLIPFLMKRMV